MFFGLVGLIQWIKRKRIYKVDGELLLLGVFYLITFLVYILFEYLHLNRRPVLINGYLEASYPSSTTFLSITFMVSAIPMINKYVSNKNVSLVLNLVCLIYMLFLVIGRALSGVHWLSDVLGSILIGSSLICFLLVFVELIENKETEIRK